jgi:SH3-like domain-containing protein
MKIRNVLRAAVLAAAAVGFAVAASGTKTMTVQIRSGALRPAPSHLKRPFATLPYGTVVSVQAERGAWYQVKDRAGKTGWMHRTALTSERLVLRAGDDRVATTTAGDEVGLATKGFDPQVEAEVRKKNPNLNFAWVDRMEKIVIPLERLAAFVTEGNLRLEEGGAQ